MLTVAGIDYSMTCPAVCVHIGDVWSLDNCRFLYITKEKRYQGLFFNKTIQGIEANESYANDTERYAGLARIVIDYLDDMGCDNTLIEGYSMGSRGRVFHIGENTGILKHMLMNDDVEFDVRAPTVIKKFASDKGNANKDLMFKAFLAETNVDLRKEFDYNKEKIDSPIADIVDAYYICKYNFKEHKE